MSAFASDAIRNLLDGLCVQVSNIVVCPITCAVIQNPACFGGRMYEKSELRKALAARPNVDPCTRVYSKTEEIKDGFLVRDMVQTWGQSVDTMRMLADFYVKAAPDKEQERLRLEFVRGWEAKINQ